MYSIRWSVPVTHIICHDLVTKVLVRSLGYLEDGGGLTYRQVIYTHRQASVVPIGRRPMGVLTPDSVYEYVFNPQHCMPDGSPLGQGSSPVLLRDLLSEGVFRLRTW